jgi:hypothetical protein
VKSKALPPMRNTIVGALFALVALSLAAGCGGGGGNTTTPTAVPTGTATPTYIPTGAPATVAPVGTASPSAASVANGNYGLYLVFPATTSGSGTMTVTGSTSVPSVPAGITAYSGSGTTLFYVVLQPSATVTFPAYPQFQLTTPPSVVPQNNNFFGAVYTNDATFPAGHNAWSAQFLGAASDSGQVLTFPNPSTPLTFTAGETYVFALYEVAT